MVAIKDIEMPSCCMNCGLLGKEEMYCSIYPRRDIDVITIATMKPDWCPLVEIEEHKVGKWLGRVAINHSFYGRCSECGKEFQLNTWYAQNMKFCPNCGAEMQKGEDK